MLSFVPVMPLPSTNVVFCRIFLEDAPTFAPQQPASATQDHDREIEQRQASGVDHERKRLGLAGLQEAVLANHFSLGAGLSSVSVGALR